MLDETAKDNHQTAAGISHELITNNELGFSPSKLALSSITNLQKPKYQIWNRPKSECKLSKFTTVKVFPIMSGEGFLATHK